MALRMLRRPAVGDAQITPEETAALLGISRYHVYRQLSAGAIPSRKVGKRWIIYRADVERLVNRGATATEADNPGMLALLTELLGVLSGGDEATFEVTIRRRAANGKADLVGSAQDRRSKGDHRNV